MDKYVEKEADRLRFLEKLDAAKTQAERNRLGQFATPPRLASEIVTSAVSLMPARAKIRYLEPGFGTGPFYSALLRQVAATRIEAAEGFETDRHYAEPAQELWKDSNLKLCVRDFTTTAPPANEAEKFNLVVCNPPYVRHHHLTKSQKQYLQAAVSRYTHFERNGLSGLYTYFLILSKGWMAENGIGAWLIPSEFMDVNYGRLVKQFLLTKVTLLRIHRFDPKEVQFGDAMVSSAVMFIKNSRPPTDHAAQFTFGGTLETPTISESFSPADLERMPKWTGLPSTIKQDRQRENGATLGDLFTIKRGLATGCNAFFVLTPAQAKEFNLPKKFLKPILPSPRELQSNEILADERGEPIINQRRYLLSCALPENKTQDKYPALWRYLQRGKKNEIHQRYLCRHREPWYTQENRPPAPFLCTYMGRTTRRDSPFRFILNHSQATAANVYLMLYPKPVLAEWLADDPERYQAMWQALSSITPDMLMGEGRVYGGGLHKLEPKELGNVGVDGLLQTMPGWKKLELPCQLKLFAS